MDRATNSRIGIFGGFRHLATGLLLALVMHSVGVYCLAAGLDYNGGILDPARVMSTSAEVTRERYPNADDVLLDDFIITQYETDGKAVTYDDTFVKILTEKGKQDNKILTRYFVLPYSVASYALVQVYRPDGSVVNVDVEAQSRVMVDRSQMGSNIYNPNSKVLQVTIPELEIGDVVRYVARNEIVKPRVPNTWSEYEVLEYTSPIRHFVYEVRGPEALPLRSIAVKDPVEGCLTFTERTEGGTHFYRWDVKDVPRMYTEPSMPPLHTVVQRLLISTIPNWEEISRWYWHLTEPHLVATDAMREKVRELTDGLTDDTARLRAIFRFVSQEIRYMGITVEKEAPGYEPHDVALTFENRHGVCRDKAALLVAMLRTAGFSAYPVLIHNGPRKDQEVPQPFFNHAIAAVREGDGSYTLMDATDENTKELFPAYLCNQSYLVATPTGDTLRTSPIIPAAENMMTVTIEGRIDGGGNLSGSAVLSFEGINDNAYRGYFSRIQPLERRRYFEGLVKRMAAGASLTSFTIRPEDMQDTETPLSVELSFKATEILVSDGTTSMMPVPRLGTSVGMVNFVLRSAGLEKRNYPLVTEIACGVKENLRIELDPSLGDAVSVPEFAPIEDNTLSWHRSLKVEGNVLSGSSEFQLKVVEFTPEEYLGLRETLKTLEVNARKKPIFVKDTTAGEPPDSIILEQTWDYTVDSPSSWIFSEHCRRRILTYKGMKEHSELKWDYNPAWHEVTLTRARVLNGDSEKVISQQEVNLMDADWVGSAPRYPPGKTLVASLPGVEIGSIIEYEVTHHYSHRPFFAARASFASFDPIEMMKVRISVPDDMKLKAELFPRGSNPTGAVAVAPVAEERQHEGNRVVYVWSAARIPAIRREPQLPPWWSFTPTVFLSSGDWHAYSRLVGPALARAAADDDGVQKQVQALIDREHRGDNAFVVRAIRDWTARQVRQAGPGFNELPLAAVSAASTTLSEGYGNTTDRAVLTYALLRRAGMHPEFVMAGPTPEDPALAEQLIRFPAQYLFPDVLVRVRLKGDWIYLNDTTQYAALGSVAHDRGLGLALRKGRVIPVEALDDRHDREEVNYTIQLADDGTAKVRRERLAYGGNYEGRRKLFEEMPPEEFARFHQEALAALSQSAVADGDYEARFNDYPGAEVLSAVIPNYAIPDGDYYYVNLPETLGNLLGLRGDERRNPLYWGNRREFRIVTDILFPPGYRNVVLKPGEVDWQAPQGGRVTVNWSVESEKNETDGQARARIVHTVMLNPASIPGNAYPELLEINRILSHASASTLLLRKTE